MEKFFDQSVDDYGTFLESMFEYLAKRTDFYDRPEAAEELLLSSFRRHKKLRSPLKPGSIESLDVLLYPKHEKPILLKKNGFDYGQYCWTQTLSSVEITIPLKQPLESAKNLFIEFSPDKVLVDYRAESTLSLLPGSALQNAIQPDDSIWTLVSKRQLEISLAKKKPNEWWSKLFCDDSVEIASQQFMPESISSLTELDPDTRATVEKMLREQRARNGVY